MGYCWDSIERNQVAIGCDRLSPYQPQSRDLQGDLSNLFEKVGRKVRRFVFVDPYIVNVDQKVQHEREASSLYLSYHDGRHLDSPNPSQNDLVGIHDDKEVAVRTSRLFLLADWYVQELSWSFSWHSLCFIQFFLHPLDLNHLPMILLLLRA